MSIGSEVDVRHNLSKHIEYVLGIMTNKDHETFALVTVLEEISFNMPEQFDFSPEYFMKRFAEFLYNNSVIEHNSSDDVDKLCARIISKTGRNYRIVELIKAFEIMLRAWEVQVES